MSVLFSLLSAKGGWLQARHAVLSQNIANADTPEYRPHDLKAAGFEDLLRRSRRADEGVRLQATHGRHLAGQPARPASADGRPVEGYETAPSGNEVVLEEQAQHLMQTRIDYEVTTNLYQKYLNLLRTAVGTPSV